MPLGHEAAQQVLASPLLLGKHRLQLLKQLEQLTADTFRRHDLYATDRAALGGGTAAGAQLQLTDDRRDVVKVEDLRAVRQRVRPQLGREAQHVQEAVLAEAHVAAHHLQASRQEG